MGFRESLENLLKKKKKDWEQIKNEFGKLKDEPDIKAIREKAPVVMRDLRDSFGFLGGNSAGEIVPPEIAPFLTSKKPEEREAARVISDAATELEPESKAEKASKMEKNVLSRLLNLPVAPVAGALREQSRARKEGKGELTAGVRGLFKGLKENTSFTEAAQEIAPDSKLAMFAGLTADIVAPGPGELGLPNKLLKATGAVNDLSKASNLISELEAITRRTDILGPGDKLFTEANDHLEALRKFGDKANPEVKRAAAEVAQLANNRIQRLETQKLTERGKVGFTNKSLTSAEEYLYHGTNEQMLDSIAKEGLKPMRRGLLSLSKDEAYSRSFAKPGMTPQGKTNPVMFRVKADLLKGKAVSSNKSRPASDELYEVLTKEAIPPESLEVMKNGKWVSFPETYNQATKGDTASFLASSLSPGSQKTADIFNASKNQEEILRQGETSFELGDFGRSHQNRKVAEGKFDRFNEGELPATLKNTTRVFRGSNDPTNYRFDNAVHIAKMPDGTSRAVYTRLNRSGKEEVLAWHKIDDEKLPKFLETLSPNGVPERIRTANSSLEGQRFNPLAYGDTSSITDVIPKSNGTSTNITKNPQAGFIDFGAFVPKGLIPDAYKDKALKMVSYQDLPRKEQNAIVDLLIQKRVSNFEQKDMRDWLENDLELVIKDSKAKGIDKYDIDSILNDTEKLNDIFGEQNVRPLPTQALPPDTNQGALFGARTPQQPLETLLGARQDVSLPKPITEELPRIGRRVEQSDEGILKNMRKEFSLTERGRKVGLREGAALGKAKANELRAAEKLDIADVKAEIVKFAQENLPLRERGKLLATVKNAETPKDTYKALDYMEELGEEAYSRDLRTKVSKEVKATAPSKIGGVPIGKFDAPTQQRLDLARTALRMAPEEAEAKIAQNISSAGEEGLSAEKLLENELLSLSSMKNMGSEQLEKVLENIQTIKTQGRTVNELRNFNRQSEYARIKDAAIHEVTGGTGLLAPEVAIKKPGLLKKVSRAKGWLQGIDTLFDKLVKVPGEQMKGALAELAEKVHLSRNTQNTGMRQVTDILQKKFDEVFKSPSKRAKVRVLSENKKMISLGRITKGDGAVIPDWQMSQNQMYKKWMEWQDPTLRPTFEAMGWTPEMMRKIEKTMTPEVKSWAEWQLKEFYPKYGKTIAPIYELRFGVPFPSRENYSPIRRKGWDIADEKDTLLNEATHFLSSKPDSLKARVDSTKPLDLKVDGDEVLMRHVIQMEHFKAFEDTLRTMKNIFDDDRVRTAIEQNHGAGVNQTIKKLIDDITRDGHDTEHMVVALDNMRTRFVRSKIGANPVTFIKQVAGMPGYITEMPKSSITRWATGLAQFWTNPIEHTRLLMDSPMMKDRYDLGSMERDIKIAMRQDTVNKMLAGKDSFLDRLMFPTKMGDRAAVLMGGWPVYKANYDDLVKGGMPKNLAHQEALRRFERATDRSQQSGNIENLSRLQKTGGSSGRMMTIFLTSPIQQFNMVTRSIHGLRYGRGSKSSNLKNLFIAWAMLPALQQLAADGGNFRKERQARAVLMGPLNGIPMYGDAIETVVRALTGDDVFPDGGVGPFSSIANISNAIRRLKKEDVTAEDVFKAMDEFVTTGGDLIGAPLGQLSNLAEGGYAVSQGADPRRLIYSEYALDKQDNPVLEEVSQIRKDFKKPKEEEVELTTEQLIQQEIEAGVKEGKTSDEIKESIKKKVRSKILDKGVELTKEEKSIKSLGVENGARAEYITRQMKEVEGDYMPLLEDYLEKGILSEDVMDQIDITTKETIDLLIKKGIQDGDSSESIRNSIKRKLKAKAIQGELDL